MSESLHDSPRFQTPRPRRDFLGMVSMGSAATALGIAAVGAARLPMPSVFPESNSRVKLGPLGTFLGVASTAVPEHRLWVRQDAGGLYAISAVCTHLGCIVADQGEQGFFCPCHGSRFDSRGRVIGGPAPKGLAYLELQVSPDGQLVVDKQTSVPPDARLKV